jgi:hypothetical protein
MLGLVEDDLKNSMGIDTEALYPAKTIFGFANYDWRPWKTPQGLDVLVSRDFQTTTDEKGDILIYPEGDTSAPPSGRMTKGRAAAETLQTRPFPYWRMYLKHRAYALDDAYSAVK